MIILEPGGRKNLILIILVTLFSGVIIWQWFASEPFASIKQETDTSFFTDIKDGVDDPFEKINNSFDEGKEEVKIASEDIAKKAKQGQLIEEAKKYLEDKENGVLKSPSNQEGCVFQEGQWNEEILECILATSDGGTECNDGDECQGYCSVNLAEIYDEFISEGKAMEVSGACSENIFKYGCLALVEEGLVNEIVCLD